MKTPLESRRASYRRKIHYVDETLQKLFLLGLILLEVSLAAGLTWLMWQHLNQIVDDRLYQVHLAQAKPMLTELAQEAILLLGIFFAVNLLALLLIDWAWRHHVNAILRDFMQLVGKTGALDFTSDPVMAKQHQVLDLAKAQRDQDRQRLSAFRSRLNALVASHRVSEFSAPLADQLQTLQHLLPIPPTGPTAPRSPGKRRAGDPL